jgi:hypothetical protein
MKRFHSVASTAAPGRDHARCPRCHSVYLISLPSAKKAEPRVGECPNPLCYALIHYSPDDWEGKARMAYTRASVSIELDDFDKEAIRRCPDA